MRSLRQGEQDKFQGAGCNQPNLVSGACCSSTARRACRRVAARGCLPHHAWRAIATSLAAASLLLQGPATASFDVDEQAAEQDNQAEEVLSGPQPGEALPALKVLGVYDADAGQELDFVSQAHDGPILLIFVHQVTRPSVGLTRVLAKYAASRKEDGLTAGIVWLTDDRGEAEAYLLRARQSLGFEVPVGISLDGAEGPGTYGLNRDVALTILAANEGRVTASYALVQPDLTDAMPVIKQVVALLGGEMPRLEDLLPPRRPAGQDSRPQRPRARQRPQQ